MKYRQVLLGILAAAIFTGCATQPVTTVDMQYVEPDAAIETSTIVGSQIRKPWAASYTVFVDFIDGKKVMAGQQGWNNGLQGWNKPLRFTPGIHQITVKFVHGRYIASTTFNLEAKAGIAYQVKLSPDVHFLDLISSCDFWIVDATSGKPVTGLVRRPITDSMPYIDLIDPLTIQLLLEY